FIGQRDREALVEEGHLLKARPQRLVVELDRLKGVGARPESDRRAVLLRRLALRKRRLWNTVLVLLPPHVTLATHLHEQFARERVDDGDTDAVQTARDGVAATAELSTGVQDCQHDLDGRLLFLLVLRDGDAATVVDDPDAAIGEHRHVDGVAVSGERLIDRVVDNLINEVVKAAGTGRADVHTGAFANRFESLKNLDLVGAIAGFGL